MARPEGLSDQEYAQWLELLDEPSMNGSTPAHAEAPPIETLTAAATYQLPDPSPDGELLGGLLRRGSRTVLGAVTGEGKTTLSYQAVRAIVEGETFLGFAGHGKRALIIDAEQGLRTIKRRLSEARLSDCDAVDILRAPDGLTLDTEQREINRFDEILATGGYDAVIADPLYKLHRGDSNDERAMVDLMRRFDAWREQHDFGLWLPTHCRKPPAGVRFSIHELFGSSAFVRGAEVVLGLQRTGPGVARLHFFKDREGDLPVGTHWDLLFSTEHGFTRDPRQGQPKTRDRMRELLENDPNISNEKLIETLEVTKRTVERYRKELSEEEEP